MKTIFDVAKNISQDKNDISEEPEFSKLYSQFMINRIMSCSPDLVFLANEANKFKGLSDKTHYDFWNNVVFKKKRYFKYPKAEKQDKDTIEMLMDYFNESEEKTMELIEILSTQQIVEIKKTYVSGKQ